MYAVLSLGLLVVHTSAMETFWLKNAIPIREARVGITIKYTLARFPSGKCLAPIYSPNHSSEKCVPRDGIDHSTGEVVYGLVHHGRVVDVV